MAKCTQCRTRKAKRGCPALGGTICPVCCGTMRDRELHCPPACPHRERHKPYQDRRTLKKPSGAPVPAAQSDEDILRDERLAWLALHADAPLAEAARLDPSFNDADSILALEYARDKLNRTGVLIVLSEADRKPRRETGEAVLAALEACRFERSVILAEGREGYTGREKIRVLDRLILAARSVTRDNPSGRLYLERILAQFNPGPEDRERKPLIL